MRKAVAAAAVIALLFVLYAAAGTWLAPRLLIDALVAQAEQQGLALRVGAARTDPFAMSAELIDVELRGPQDAKLATARNVSVDLAWASLWGSRWIIERAVIEQPEIAVARGPQGELNWPAPAGGTAAQGEGQQEGRRPVVVRELNVRDGTLLVDDQMRARPVALKLVSFSLDVQDLSTAADESGTYAMAGRVAEGGMVSSQGRFSLEPLAAHGKIELAALPLDKLSHIAAPRSGPAHGQVHASAAFAYERGRVGLEGVSIDAANVRYGEGARAIALERLQLSAPKLAWPSREPIVVRGSAQLAGGGSLSASGDIDLEPFSANLDVQAQGIALSRAQPWLPEGVAVKLVSGTLQTNGTLRVKPDATRYTGALAVNGLRVDERDSGRLLLAWQRAETDGATLQLSPNRIELGEVEVHAPRGRLIIEPNGRVNFAAAFAAGGDDPKGSPWEAAVARLRVENGVLEFADRSLENAFAVTVRELVGTVSGFSTQKGDPARLQLAGRVEKYGAARIRGTIHIDAPKSAADIRATFRNLDLAAFTPYIAKFAGYRVESGRLTAELRYQVRDARLAGSNQVTIERMKLGEKVESASALDLPLELAVAVLSDSEGRIHLDIPVRGNLNDPQFDFGGLVAKALRNVIGRIATAPFRALAGLLGKKTDGLDAVHFAAGSAQLAPPQEEDVAMLAKALGQRPQLEVTVQGGYDPQADAAALRARTVRQEIAKRAGYGAGPLDFSDPKVLHAAENLYMKRVGNRLELQALRGSGKPYPRALMDELAATVPVDEAQAQSLAQARAQNVREALVKQGVAPERVRVEPAAPADRAKDGVPTRLSLEPR